MQGEENQSKKFIEMWVKEKVDLITYISDCVKKVLGDKNDNEEIFALCTDISFLYDPVLFDEPPDDELSDQECSKKHKDKFIDYSNPDCSKGKDRQFKVILARCSTLRLSLGLVLEDIANDRNDKIDSLELVTYEQQINSLVIYASLLLASSYFHIQRTRKSTDTRRRDRRQKEKIVYEAFRRLLLDKKPKDRKWLAGLSEDKFAGMVKDEISGDLKTAGIYKISNETIIDILHKRDKNKFPWYPWEKASRM